VGVPRNTIVKALQAELPVTLGREKEGVLIRAGYVKPLYLNPIYQTQTVYGSVQCPFKCPHYSGTPSYAAVICPNTEKIQDNSLILHELFRPSMSNDDLQSVADAFHKVWDQMADLHAYEE